jgi:hypothetical protein
LENNKLDVPIWVIIHIYMEISQAYSLYSYLKQTKMSLFLYKIRKQESKTGSVWVVGTSGGRRM